MRVMVAVVLCTWAAQAEIVAGVQLPDNASKVAERRYQTRGSFDDALKYFRTVYPPAQYPRRSIVNQPGVKAVHITNPSGKVWEGLNVYETADGVRIYIVAAPGSGKGKPKKRAK